MKHMTSKTDNLKDLDYYGNFEVIATTLLEWSKKKKNAQLDKVIQSLNNIAFYVNSLQMDRYANNKAVEDYRCDKNRAVERARKAEELADKLQKENSKLQKIVNL